MAICSTPLSLAVAVSKKRLVRQRRSARRNGMRGMKSSRRPHCGPMCTLCSRAPLGKWTPVSSPTLKEFSPDSLARCVNSFISSAYILILSRPSSMKHLSIHRIRTRICKHFTVHFHPHADTPNRSSTKLLWQVQVTILWR